MYAMTQYSRRARGQAVALGLVAAVCAGVGRLARERLQDAGLDPYSVGGGWFEDYLVTDITGDRQESNVTRAGGKHGSKKEILVECGEAEGLSGEEEAGYFGESETCTAFKRNGLAQGGRAMSTLLDSQMRFAGMVADLIQHAIAMGYGVTIGEAYRSPEEAARLAKTGAGVVNSLHCQRLAIDINLFRKGVYFGQTSDYLPLGEWWEARGGAWGGRFTRADGNHFSLALGGVK